MYEEVKHLAEVLADQAARGAAHRVMQDTIDDIQELLDGIRARDEDDDDYTYNASKEVLS